MYIYVYTLCTVAILFSIIYIDYHDHHYLIIVTIITTISISIVMYHCYHHYHYHYYHYHCYLTRAGYHHHHQNHILPNMFGILTVFFCGLQGGFLGVIFLESSTRSTWPSIFLPARKNHQGNIATLELNQAIYVIYKYIYIMMIMI